MSKEEIRLTIPAEEEFRPIAHLVSGGLASHFDVTYDDLADLQVAIEALLALRDDGDGIVVALAVEGDILSAELGPFSPETVQDDDERGSDLDLRRVLETVCDTHGIDHRPDGAWVELTKTLTAVAGGAGGEATGPRPQGPAAFGGGGARADA
jgi:hypothetical protein